MTTSIAEHATIIFTIVLGMPLPLLPTQILWLNLVTDGVTGVALATEKVHHEVLKEKPRKKEENIINKEIFPFMILVTLVMLVLTLVLFNHYLPDEKKARTVAFTVMSLTQLFNMFNLRSMNRSLFKIKFFSNKFVVLAFFVSLILLLSVIYVPFLMHAFNFTSLTVSELVIFFVLSSLVLWFGEGYKFYKNRKSGPAYARELRSLQLQH